MKLAEEHGAVVSVVHGDYGEVRESAMPYRFEGQRRKFAAGPRLGQDTDELLTGLLGYSAEDVDGLRKMGAVG